MEKKRKRGPGDPALQQDGVRRERWDHLAMAWDGRVLDQQSWHHDHDRPASGGFRHAHHDRHADRFSGRTRSRRDPVTHSDNDHYSVPTCRALAPVTRAYHSTDYVASLMQNEGWPAHGHAIGDTVDIGPVRVELTPADHAWQNASPGASERVFQPEDACGFWIDTPDGTIWAPGDSRLIPDHHLRMPSADALLFDFSDSEWHFGLQGAARMANAYPRRRSCSITGGCVDAELRALQRRPGLVTRTCRESRADTHPGTR